MAATRSPARRALRLSSFPVTVAATSLVFGLLGCEAQTLSLLSSESVRKGPDGGAALPPSSGGSAQVGLPDAEVPPLEAEVPPPEASHPHEPDSATDPRACADNSDCGGWRPRCEKTSGRCVQCLLPADCGFTATCDPVAYRCAAPCLSDWDCPVEWAYCAVDRGVCIQCTSDVQCPAPFTRYCDLIPGECVGCLEDFQCPEQAPVCHPERRQCVQCSDGTSCPLGARCDLREGRCYFGP